MTFTSLNWRIADVDHAVARTLAESMAIPRVVALLLCRRGIQTAADAKAFLGPCRTGLCDPMCLTDMDAAVARIERARTSGEHVRVFGDYDVDGVSGTALLVNGLRRFGVGTVSFALPNRLLDGYGLQAEHVEQARCEGVSLLITVDNGIKSHEAAVAAHAAGIDLIITDHHTLDDTLPQCTAVINPKRNPEASACADLAGAAVALKLVTALGVDAPQDYALAALGIVADLVPLHGQNRVLAALGIDALRDDPPVGVAALMRRIGVAPATLRAETIGFQIGPRINAVGRLNDGTPALRLLLTEDEAEADALAAELDEANEWRRQLEKETFEGALALLEAKLQDADRTIVLADGAWHPGIVGIVAARLQRRYWRPTVLIARGEQGLHRGSARSCPDYNIIEGFAACSEHLTRFGGHHAAAGMAIEAERIDDFARALEAHARTVMDAGERRATLNIDCLMGLSELDGGLMYELNRLEPHGQANPAPVFYATGVEVLPNSAREVGRGHLRLTVRQNGTIFTAIGFGMAERMRPGDVPQWVDVAFTPSIERWRGQESIQLQMKDMRVVVE